MTLTLDLYRECPAGISRGADENGPPGTADKVVRSEPLARAPRCSSYGLSMEAGTPAVGAALGVRVPGVRRVEVKMGGKAEPDAGLCQQDRPRA